MENNSDRMGFALIALSVVAFVLLAVNGPLKSTVGGFFNGFKDWQTQTVNGISESNKQDVTHTAYSWSSDGTDGFYVGSGRNLLLGTRDFSGINTRGNKVAVTNGQETFQATTGTFQGSSATYFDIVNFWSLPLEKDTDYTASFWVKTSENTNIWSYLYDSGSNGNYADSSTVNQATTNYTRFVVHFHNGNNTATPSFIPVRIQKPGVTVWVYGCMLEKGTVAHPWSPAPSDQPKYIGTYTDKNDSASQDPAKYTWKLNPDYHE